MEKLKAKHDHKLTDILKVMIFALFLILPGIFILPSMLYYGVNEYATAPTEQVEIYEYKQVDFNQNVRNGNFTDTTNWSTYTFSSNFTLIDNELYVVSNGEGLSLRQNFPTDLLVNHKVLLSFMCYSDNITSLSVRFGKDTNTIINRDYTIDNVLTRYDYIYTLNNNVKRLEFLRLGSSVSAYFTNIQLFDLTTMYGTGQEPTIEEFRTYYNEEYYDYIESKIETLEIPTGNYKTYTDITSQIQYNWTSLWQQPLFNWTNYTIVKQGIDNFTGVFGITNTSNISNLIAYELIIVAIYIVIDIVLTLFKWLTHLIGEK